MKGWLVVKVVVSCWSYPQAKVVPTPDLAPPAPHRRVNGEDETSYRVLGPPQLGPFGSASIHAVHPSGTRYPLIKRSSAADPLSKVLVQIASRISVHPSERSLAAVAASTCVSANEVLNATPPVTVLHPEAGLE